MGWRRPGSAAAWCCAWPTRPCCRWSSPAWPNDGPLREGDRQAGRDPAGGGRGRNTAGDQEGSTLAADPAIPITPPAERARAASQPGAAGQRRGTAARAARASMRRGRLGPGAAASRRADLDGSCCGPSARSRARRACRAGPGSATRSTRPAGTPATASRPCPRCARRSSSAPGTRRARRSPWWRRRWSGTPARLNGRRRPWNASGHGAAQQGTSDREKVRRAPTRHKERGHATRDTRDKRNCDWTLTIPFSLDVYHGTCSSSLVSTVLTSSFSLVPRG